MLGNYRSVSVSRCEAAVAIYRIAFTVQEQNTVVRTTFSRTTAVTLSGHDLNTSFMNDFGTSLKQKILLQQNTFKKWPI